jgi:hypothetical protein
MTTRRIVAIGSTHWNDRRTTMAALKRVMEVYRDPYTLVCDMSDGAARYAAAAARSLGWALEAYEVDTTKCQPDCPTDNHRRRGGPEGDWCPGARPRNLALMLDTNPDLCLFLVRPHGTSPSRIGQAEAKRRGIAVWQYEQKGKSDGDTTS